MESRDLAVLRLAWTCPGAVQDVAAAAAAAAAAAVMLVCYVCCPPEKGHHGRLAVL